MHPSAQYRSLFFLGFSLQKWIAQRKSAIGFAGRLSSRTQLTLTLEQGASLGPQLFAITYSLSVKAKVTPCVPS